MFTLTHTLDTTAAPDRVWACISAPTRWAEWQEDLDEVRFQGPLSLRAQGVLEVGGSTRRFWIEQITPNRELVWVITGFLRQARVIQRVEPCSMGARLTQQVEVRGLLAWLDPYYRRRRLESALPSTTRRLAMLAATQ